MTRQSRDESWRTSGYLNRHWESTENWHRLAGRGGNCSRSIDASRREGVLYAVRPAPVVGETRTVIRRFHPLPPSTSSVPLFSPFPSRVFCDPLRSRTSSFTFSYLLLSDTTSSTSFSSVSLVSLSLSLSLSLCFIVSAFFLPSSLVHWALYFTFYGRRWDLLDQKKWPEGCEIVLVLSVFLNAKWDINGRIFGSLDREEFLWNGYQWWKICLECKYGAFLDAIWFLYDSSLSPYESL